MSALETNVVRLAQSYLFVREVSPNSSPEIDAWLAFTGCKPGQPYCASWISFLIFHAAAGLAIPPIRFVKSAGALGLRNVNPSLRLTPAEAHKRLTAGRPCVGGFPVGTKGHGHVFLATGLHSEKLDTLEANTNAGPAVPSKDRDGDGVHARSDRAFDTATFWIEVA